MHSSATYSNLNMLHHFPGQQHSFTVSVRPANNLPADIYFLMDHSNSMEDDLENIRNLASQLGKSIN